MTPDARKVPTRAGLWWLRDGAGNAYVAQVDIDPVDGILSFWTDDGRLHEDSAYVRDDGRWLCPVLTPAEFDALTATVARLERERDDAAAMLVVAHAEIARLREAIRGADPVHTANGWVECVFCNICSNTDKIPHAHDCIYAELTGADHD